MDYVNLFIEKMNGSLKTEIEVLMFWLGFCIVIIAELLKENYIDTETHHKFRWLHFWKSVGISFGVYTAFSVLGPIRGFPIYAVLSAVSSHFIYNKFLKQLDTETFEEELPSEPPDEKGGERDVVYESDDSVEDSELAELKRKFGKCISPSIMEILLIYGYIGQNHKERAEIDNIFDSPDEIAEKLKTMPVLTDEQLNEARAIMNIIRREGQVITKQVALRILSEMQKNVGSDKK